MPTFVNVLFTDNGHDGDDGHWVVEFNGERVAYASRGIAINAGVHKALEESAFLMIYEREADTGAAIDLRGVNLPPVA